MLSILNSRLNTVKEIISCLEGQVESELNNDFFGIDEALICRLKNKIQSKRVAFKAMMKDLEMHEQQQAA